MGYALVCFSTQVPWAAERQVFPTSGFPNPSPENGAVLKDYTQRLQEARFPRSGCRKEQAHQARPYAGSLSVTSSVLQFPDKIAQNPSSHALAGLEVIVSGLSQGS